MLLLVLQLLLLRPSEFSTILEVQSAELSVLILESQKRYSLFMQILMIIKHKTIPKNHKRHFPLLHFNGW